jgi:hypothetical protein
MVSPAGRMALFYQYQSRPLVRFLADERRSPKMARVCEGACLPRIGLQAETAEELWPKDMHLTEAEASFRALKSELSIRPLCPPPTVMRSVCAATRHPPARLPLRAYAIRANSPLVR